MEAGERELRKAFEEVTTRNVKAILDHNNETRKMVIELINKINTLEGKVREQDGTISQLRMMLSTIQAKVYQGGTD